VAHAFSARAAQRGRAVSTPAGARERKQTLLAGGAARRRDLEVELVRFELRLVARGDPRLDRTRCLLDLRAAASRGGAARGSDGRGRDGGGSAGEGGRGGGYLRHGVLDIVAPERGLLVAAVLR